MRSYGSIPLVHIIFPHTLLLLFFSCLATRDGPKNICHLDQQQVQEEKTGKHAVWAPPKNPARGRNGESRARALLAPPRTIWGPGTGWRRCDAGPGGKVQDIRHRRRDAGISRRMKDRRKSGGAPCKTHFLAQVKEHPGSPERTTPAVKARNWKRSKSPIASTSGSLRLPSP